MNTPKTKWASAPWKLVRLNSRWHVASHEGRLEIAAIAEYKDAERSKANAQLIALSPEWPEVLRSLLVETDQHATGKCIKLKRACEDARALLDKLPK